MLQPLHARAQHLGGQKRAVPVHRQAGKLVRLAENNAAVRNVRPHYRLAVFPRIAQAAVPERFVKHIVRIARKYAHAYLALQADEPRAKPASLLAEYVGQRAVFTRLGGQHLLRIYPRVPGGQASGRLGRHCEHGELTSLFHHKTSFSVQTFCIIMDSGGMLQGARHRKCPFAAPSRRFFIWK